MSTGRQRQVYRPTKLERLKLFFRENPWWGFLGIVLAILGIVLTIVLVRYPELLTDEPPARLGEARQSGDIMVTVTDVECGKSLSDLSQELQDLEPQEGGLPPVKGQLCLASTRIRNGSVAAQSMGAMLVIMYVGDNQFLISGADPLLAPVAFPDETVEIEFIFDIPATASPTKLMFQWPEEDPVEVALT